MVPNALNDTAGTFNLRDHCQLFIAIANVGSCHKRQKPQAPTPQAPIRSRQTRKFANAKGLNGNTNLA